MRDSRNDRTVFRAKMKRIVTRVEYARDALEKVRNELEDALEIVEAEVVAGIGRLEMDVASARDAVNAAETLLVHAGAGCAALLKEEEVE